MKLHTRNCFNCGRFVEAVSVEPVVSASICGACAADEVAEAIGLDRAEDALGMTDAQWASFVTEASASVTRWWT